MLSRASISRTSSTDPRRGLFDSRANCSFPSCRQLGTMPPVRPPAWAVGSEARIGEESAVARPELSELDRVCYPSLLSRIAKHRVDPKTDSAHTAAHRARHSRRVRQSTGATRNAPAAAAIVSRAIAPNNHPAVASRIDLAARVFMCRPPKDTAVASTS